MHSLDIIPNIKIILVVDVSVIFSAVLGDGNSWQIFYLNAKEKKFEFIAAEFVFIELNKHTERIAKKTQLSLDEAKEALEFISKQIDFILDEEFKEKFPKAREMLKEHQKDAHYLALALKYECKSYQETKSLNN